MTFHFQVRSDLLQCDRFSISSESDYLNIVKLIQREKARTNIIVSDTKKCSTRDETKELILHVVANETVTLTLSDGDSL